MTGHGVTDIETLCLIVRDRESRRLIMEGITAMWSNSGRNASNGGIETFMPIVTHYENNEC